MTVLITGGAGFLGQRLVRRLLERGHLSDQSGNLAPVGRIVLVDRVRAADFGDPRVDVVVGDIGAPGFASGIVDRSTSSVFHLAAVVSGQAEQDFDLGMRVNLDGARLVLDACRHAGTRPRVVFTSSVAVYGGDLPTLVTDATALHPRSSYGIQKAIGELLLVDYTRRGFVDGRVARLPTISVRPGRPNRAASSFASGLIREPLRGEAAVCPVGGNTRLWLLSPGRAIDCLVAVHDLARDSLGPEPIVNLPGVSVSVDEMIAALRIVGGDAAVARIVFERDPVVERIVGSWPAAWDVTRAHALGLSGDASFEEIVRAHVAESTDATCAG